MRKLGAALCALMLAGPAFATGLKIEVAGEANGVIEVDLFEDIAPKHVAQITQLAKDGFYDDVVFHRVIRGFMAQTGDGEHGKLGDKLDMRRAGTGGSPLPDIEAEFSETNFDRGVLGMARSGDPKCARKPNCQEGAQFLNSANSQFFIMFDPGEFLNGKYTAVGKVTSGMDVVDQIKKGSQLANGAITGEPDRMVKVTVTE